MARSHRFFREGFDWDREFVALRSFVFSGKAHVPGQPIIKEKMFTTRRLRQLFDRRDVGYPNEYWQNIGFVPPDGMVHSQVSLQSSGPQPKLMDPEPTSVPRRQFTPRPVGGAVERRHRVSA